MILINVGSRLRAVIDDPTLTQQINESISLLRRYFMHPEFKALLETVGSKGEFIDTNAACTINPGHCIETAWFIMEEAKLRNWDKDLLDTALTIFDWSWDWDGTSNMAASSTSVTAVTSLHRTIHKT